MKKLIFIFALSALYLMPKAQDKEQKISDVERFYTTPGRTVTGYLVYRDSYGLPITGVTAMAMKYVDSSAKDTAYGITFSYCTHNTSGECTVFKNYEIVIDYEEFDKVISWFESNLGIINNSDSSVGLLTYVPEKGNFILKLERNVNQKGSIYTSNSWHFVIQANKYDIDSQKSFSTNMKTVIENLKIFRRMIKKQKDPATV